MNQVDAYIRRVLHPFYPPREAASLSRIICCEELGMSVTSFYTDKGTTLLPNQKEKLENVLQRLCRMEPIQYIQGYAPFCGRRFEVTPAVLIPRPETEELVELVLHEVPSPAGILDIGTGSGCIAVTLACACPSAEVSAWDVSEEALPVARRNAAAHGARVEFCRCDVLGNALPATGALDVVVSNPPYVTVSEQRDMERGVLDYEPPQALFVSDDDPLLFYRRIAALAGERLQPGGRLFFEANRMYAGQVADLLEGMGFRKVAVRQDMSHNPRFVIAEKL